MKRLLLSWSSVGVWERCNSTQNSWFSTILQQKRKLKKYILVLYFEKYKHPASRQKSNILFLFPNSYGDILMTVLHSVSVIDLSFVILMAVML